MSRRNILCTHIYTYYISVFQKIDRVFNEYRSRIDSESHTNRYDDRSVRRHYLNIRMISDILFPGSSVMIE